MPFTIDSARNIFPDTLAADTVPATIARYWQLSAEDQLALIWFAYLEMGESITPVAPDAACMALAGPTLAAIEMLSFQEQSQVMCDLANRASTPICRIYATWTPNVKLGFWYQLGEWMNQGLVAPIPEGYKLSTNASAILRTIGSLEAGQQITVLRSCAIGMGYDNSKLGTFKRVAEPVTPPTAIAQRTQVVITGVTNPMVLDYMDNLNANDFEALIELFEEDGGLQPPFQRPIVGRDSILQFFKEECQA